MIKRIIHRIKKNILNSYTYKKNENIKWCGNNYGGFFIDNSLVKSSNVVFSVGVGEDISFDEALVKMGVKRIYLFDPTPKSKQFFEDLQPNDNYIFHNVGISEKNELKKFFLPKNPTYVSGSIFSHKNTNVSDFIEVELKKISTLLAELNLDHLDILKIDIEGSEYEVLQHLMVERIFPQQICVEFHNRYFKNGEILFQETIQSLKKNGYEISGISKSGEEYLFIRENIR